MFWCVWVVECGRDGSEVVGGGGGGGGGGVQGGDEVYIGWCGRGQEYMYVYTACEEESLNEISLCNYSHTVVMHTMNI